jgi:hypothetical protein
MSNPTIKRATPVTLAELLQRAPVSVRRETTHDAASVAGGKWLGPPQQLGKGDKSELRRFINKSVTGAVRVAEQSGNPCVLRGHAAGELEKLFTAVEFVLPSNFKHATMFTPVGVPSTFYKFVERSFEGSSVEALLREANVTYVASFGNLQSLVGRFVNHVIKVPVDTRIAVLVGRNTAEWLSSLFKSTDLPGQLGPYFERYVIHNKSAADGLPFQAPHVYAKDTTVRKTSYEPTVCSTMLAEYLLTTFKSVGSLKQFLEAHEFLVTVCMSPKVEAYKRSKLWDKTTYSGLSEAEVKTRAIFIWPGWIQVAIGPLAQAYRKEFPLFTENPSSPNAIGMSWTRGGAQKVVDHFKNLADGEESVLVYGDDILYGRREGDSIVFFAPDVKAMDLSLRRVHADGFLNLLRAVYPALPVEIQRFLPIFAPLMTTAPILLESMVLRSKGGLRSGAPLTSELDSFVSLMVYTLYQMRKEEGQHFEDVAPKLARELGLQYNEETLKPHVYHDGDTSLGVTFLGVSVVYVETPHGAGWIPRRSDADTAKSLVCPKLVSGEDRSPSVELGRLISLYAWGYWAEDESCEMKNLIRQYALEFRCKPYFSDQAPWLKLPDISEFPDDSWFAQLFWGEEGDEFESVPSETPTTVMEPPPSAEFSWADEVDYQEILDTPSVALKPKLETTEADVIAEKRSKKDQPAVKPKAVKPQKWWQRR